MVHGQQDYTIPSTCQRVQRVATLDENGNWQLLKQRDIHELDVAPDEYRDRGGLPVEYDIFGRTLNLYPVPASASVTTADGLKVYFDRDVDQFTPGDTSKEPGFAKPFHRILSLGASIDYLRPGNRRNELVRAKDVLEEGLRKFYGKRNIEKKSRIRPYLKNKWKQYL